MIYAWLIFTLVFLSVLALLVVWPLALHPTLPRAKKWWLCSGIALLLVPGGWLLYGWVGMPGMALLQP